LIWTEETLLDSETTPRGWDSPVTIVTERLNIIVRFPTGTKEFSPLQSVQTDSEAQKSRVQCLRRAFSPRKSGTAVKVTTYLHVMAMLRMSGDIPPLSHMPLGHGCANPGHQTAWATKFCTVGPNIWAPPAWKRPLYHTYGALNFEVARKFLQTFCTPAIRNRKPQSEQQALHTSVLWMYWTVWCLVRGLLGLIYLVKETHSLCGSKSFRLPVRLSMA
jgi:hypothetical protein